MSQSSDDIRILIVEDDQSLLQMITALLESEGYAVEGAADGESAIKLAQAESFDLVVTDVRLGKLDGLDTLEELKRSDSTFQSLVMTGYSTEADTIRALKLGVGNYLKKPFSLDDFLLAVQEQVSQAVRERQIQARETAAIKTLCWALESVVRGDAETSQMEQLGGLRAAALAERTSLALSLSPRVTLAVKALTLLNCLKQEGLAPWDEEAVNGFPEPIPKMAADLVGKTLSQCPREVQLVKVCVASSTIDTSTESLTEELRDQFPDLSQELGEALELALQDEFAPSNIHGERGRSLFSLASALQARGDVQGAAQALSRLQHRMLSPESLKAQLLEIRLRWESLSEETAIKQVKALVEQSTKLGGRIHGLASLDCGLLLVERGVAQAQQLLTQAILILESQGAREDLARAELGLVAAGAGSSTKVAPSLQVLMQARHLEAFLRAGPWLLPLLLKLEAQESSPEVQRALRRLIRDLPEVSGNLVRRGLDKPLLKVALQTISVVGKAGHEETLNWLCKNSDHPEIKAAATKLLGNDLQPAVPPVLRIYLTGSFETWFGNSLVSWSGPKYQYLFAYICSASTTLVPLELLVETFWPDHGKRGNRCLSQALTSIRKLLQPPGWNQKLAYVERGTDGVGLNVKLPIWSDIQEIRKALQEAKDQEQQNNLKESMAAIRSANETYRGTFMAGCYMDWALTRRTKILRLLNEATLRLAKWGLESDSPLEALAEVENVLARDPVNEMAQGIKMGALSAVGRSAEAVRSFESFARTLSHEVGVEPSTELLKSYHLARMAD